MTTVKYIVALMMWMIAPFAMAQIYQLQKVADQLGIPWGMSFVAADVLLISDRGGEATLLNLKTAEKQAVTGLPRVRAKGQGGLLDVAMTEQAPGWVYITYSRTHQGQGITELARARLQGSVLQDWEVLLSSLSAFDSDRHYGSRIAFDTEGHVFVSIGDRGVRDNGQDLKTHAGSIVRLKLDGSIPKDNPFVNREDAQPEIWSYGHRNPQGLFYDVENKQLWSIEHGPRGGDEINLILKGRNYGWPLVSHGKEYWGPFAVGEATSKPTMEDPRKVYIPSIAPSGLMRYSGKVFKDWKGSLLTGALKLTHLNRVELDKDLQVIGEERLFQDLQQRIRNVIEGPDGLIYFTTDSGELYRIVAK